MDITISYEQGRVPITVFHVKGDIDISTYEQLQQQAKEAYQAGTRNLLLDLTEVPYLSSAGIRALHQIFTLLRSNTPEES
ncbi:MAG: STAS domain-containing protein, partial [Anaerolineales bacterium]